LRHCDNEGSKLTCPVLVKIELDMELFLGVNLELTTWTVVVISKLVNIVLKASSTSVAVVVESVVWSIARVSGCLPCPLVGLHDIELRAVVASNLVTIAVVVTICVPKVAVLASARHSDQVDGSNATTVPGAKVNIVLDTATKEVWLEELVGVKIWCLRQHSS
jgi:hypothetical protein